MTRRQPTGTKNPPPGPNTLVREARLFKNGRSQAVRLPAECRFEGESVFVKKWRGAVVLLPKDNPWLPLLDSLGKFSPDYLAARDQPAGERRAGLGKLFDR